MIRQQEKLEELCWLVEVEYHGYSRTFRSEEKLPEHEAELLNKIVTEDIRISLEIAKGHGN